MTELSERMRLHKPGQVTWPELSLRLRCDSCDHFSGAGVKAPGKGRCVLVRKHQRVDGAIFDGAQAIACPQHRHRGAS